MAADARADARRSWRLECALDTPWPKLERIKSGVARGRDEGRVDDVGALLDLLADRTTAPDAALPATGVTLEWERLLSAPFIVSPALRHALLDGAHVARDGAVSFHERSFDAAGRADRRRRRKVRARRGPGSGGAPLTPATRTASLLRAHHPIRHASGAVVKRFQPIREAKAASRGGRFRPRRTASPVGTKPWRA